MTTPFDYDANPERFRLATRVTRQHLTASSLYELLAEALAELDPRRILDIGCGEGALRAALPTHLAPRTVGLDAAATMLGAHPPPVVRADAAALPFADGVFDVAVAVNVLDHLPEPPLAIAEAHRVLANGGTLVAATTPPSWPRSGAHRPPASTPRMARPGGAAGAAARPRRRPRLSDRPLRPPRGRRGGRRAGRDPGRHHQTGRADLRWQVSPLRARRRPTPWRR